MFRETCEQADVEENLTTDGREMRQVVDGTKNEGAETDKGRLHKFMPVPGRYVKVNMLKNSANPAVHLVEVRVYEARE